MQTAIHWFFCVFFAKCSGCNYLWFIEYSSSVLWFLLTNWYFAMMMMMMINHAHGLLGCLQACLSVDWTKATGTLQWLAKHPRWPNEWSYTKSSISVWYWTWCNSIHGPTRALVKLLECPCGFGTLPNHLDSASKSTMLMISGWLLLNAPTGHVNFL